MPSLSKEIRKKILELLIPIVETQDERIGLLHNAFDLTSKIKDRIDIGGAPATFAEHLVDALIIYGEIEEGKQALWELLMTVHDGYVGVDKQKIINDIYPYIKALSESSKLDIEHEQRVDEEIIKADQPSDESKNQLSYDSTDVVETSPVSEIEPIAPTITEQLTDQIQYLNKEKFNTIQDLKIAFDYVNTMRPIPPENPQFYLASSFVSNYLFYQFTCENKQWSPSQKKSEWFYLKHWENDKPTQEDYRLPVTYITIEAAKAFADWLTELTNKPVRLLNIQEWELAVKANRMDWFEKEIQAGHVNYSGTSNKLCTVDAFNPNLYGVRDLLGNAYDLCISVERHIEKVVLTGGCYYNTKKELQNMCNITDENLRKFISFRCVRELKKLSNP